MPQKDAFSWNATVGGFATHGHGREAIYPFDQMQKIGDKSLIPYLLGVLYACNHSGMVHEGYFNYIPCVAYMVLRLKWNTMDVLKTYEADLDEASDFAKNTSI